MGDNRLMEGIRQRGVKMCHTRDPAADISQMVSDKRSPPIFVQPQRLKHKYGKNTAGFRRPWENKLVSLVYAKAIDPSTNPVKFYMYIVYSINFWNLSQMSPSPPPVAIRRNYSFDNSHVLSETKCIWFKIFETNGGKTNWANNTITAASLPFASYCSLLMCGIPSVLLSSFPLCKNSFFGCFWKVLMSILVVYAHRTMPYKVFSDTRTKISISPWDFSWASEIFQLSVTYNPRHLSFQQ